MDFFRSIMNQKLLLIFNQLNESNVLYGLGGSMMLKLRLFEIEPHDIDLFVSVEDYHQTMEIFREHTTQLVTTSKHPFKTLHFTSFSCEDITIDIMAGFRYLHLDGTYTALFDKLSITGLVHTDNIEIPLMSLEEWYVLYSVMNRNDKVEMIEKRWRNQNLEHLYLLERQLNLELPYSLKQKILNYLQNKGSLNK